MTNRMLLFGMLFMASLLLVPGCKDDDDGTNPPDNTPMVCMRDDYIGTFKGTESCEVGNPQVADPSYVITEGPNDDEAIVNGGDIANQIVTVDGCEFENKVQVLNNSVTTTISLSNDTLRVHNVIVFGGVTTSDCMFVGKRQ